MVSECSSSFRSISCKLISLPSSSKSGWGIKCFFPNPYLHLRSHRLASTFTRMLNISVGTETMAMMSENTLVFCTAERTITMVMTEVKSCAVYFAIFRK